jgi:hypothetical protein
MRKMYDEENPETDYITLWMSAKAKKFFSFVGAVELTPRYDTMKKHHSLDAAASYIHSIAYEWLTQRYSNPTKAGIPAFNWSEVKPEEFMYVYVMLTSDIGSWDVVAVPRGEHPWYVGGNNG